MKRADNLPLLVVLICREGVQPIEIRADNEREEEAAKAILDRIQPCLDVIDAILKRTGAGPRG